MLIRKQIIFFFLFFIFDFLFSLPSYFVSLNEDNENLELEQWAEAEAGMPALSELTLCHWEFLTYINLNSANLWSYCVKEISKIFFIQISAVNKKLVDTMLT